VNIYVTSSEERVKGVEIGFIASASRTKWQSTSMLGPLLKNRIATYENGSLIITIHRQQIIPTESKFP